MAEEQDFEQRTEAPSQRRLEKAREDGQVARSRELTTFAVLAGSGALLWVTGASLAGHGQALLKSALHLDRAAALDPQTMLDRLHDQSLQALWALAPFLGVTFLIALVAPALLGGWVFSLKPLAPNFSRLDPIGGIARIFSWHGLNELVKALIKAILVGVVASWVIWHNKEALLQLMTLDFRVAAQDAGRLLIMGFLAIAGSLALIAAVDAPFQLWDHYRKLRMTKEELRREAKETEGDPHVKAHIRSVQREMARRRMMAEVPKADVVVTNPTHYAVALSYRTDAAGKKRKAKAPVVVAKGTESLAARIREIAAEHQVPVLEAAPLARALYRHTELGHEIPNALYTAVAEVLAYVYQLRRYREHGGVAPRAPQDIPVPAELDPLADSAGSETR